MSFLFCLGVAFHFTIHLMKFILSIFKKRLDFLSLSDIMKVDILGER